MHDVGAWREYLRGAVQAVALPADRLRTSSQLGHPVHSTVDIGPGTEAGAAGQLALAALAVLLSRYTGETELLLGWQRAEHPGRVQPVRLRVAADVSPADLLRQVAESLAAGERLGDLAVAELAELRGLTAAPTPPCHAVLFTGAPQPPEQACAELVLAAGEGHGQHTLACSADRYAAETVARLAAHLGVLARGLATGAPSVAAVPLLSSAEVHRALVEWNDTAQPVPGHYLHERVARIAADRPDAPAVVHLARTVTFGELDGQANRMASYLASLGVAPGARVALCLERSAESLITQLAVFKVGATVVLMDPEYPEQRLAYMLEHAGCAALVTRRVLADALFASATCPVVLADTPSWQQSAAAAPAGPVHDDLVCHIAYTSGSTGKPKAVMLRHGPLRNTVHTLVRQCGIAPGERGTWLSSPGFGLVEVDCLPLLAAGGAVHIPDPAVAASAEELRDWLVGQRITHTLLLTAMAERLWQLPWPGDAPLRTMRVAGERLRSWPPADLPYQVLNVYGSAEATVVATAELVGTARRLAAQGTDRMPPIGRPAGNVRIYVLDGRMRPVPPGAIGELHVSGASLSAGYLNQAEATGQKFLANPLPGDPYPVLYRTGDLARYWPDGTVEIVGRTDNEVKIRGYRVHLGEVESVLAAQPGVRQAAVLAREDTPGERRLVGYVVPDPVAPAAVRGLREALREALPPYMVPAVFVLADDLPLTPNGKIDRAALPAPPRSRPDLAVPYQAPSDNTERALAEAWSQALDIDDVGIRDSFFELGGDSLRAMRLLAAIRDRLGVQLPLSELYQAPSVAEAATVIGRLRHERVPDSTGLPALAPDPAARYLPYPLTENQQALWIGRGDAVDFGNVGAHGYFEWEREGLDVDRFRRAWRALLGRHDMLRTVIRPDGTQVVLTETDGDGIVVTDLRDVPAAQARERADAIRAEMSHQVIPADRWPLYDVRLTRLPGDVVRLHFGLDMLIMDAWSAFQVLFPELIELYENPGASLPKLAVSFRDYVVGAAESVRVSGELERSRRYWLDRLDTLPAAPDLPMVNAPAGPVRFDRREASLPPPHWERLRRRASRSGITQNGVLVAAFAEVLRVWSANDRFTINFPIFDRLPLHPQIDAVLGDFTNTVLVAAEKTDGTFVERARDLQLRLWQDLEHRYFNGVEVLRELARRAGGALRPAMPIVLTSLLGQPPRRQVSGLGRETYGISQTPQVLLDFQIREIDGVLHLKWDFLAEMFPDGMIDAMFSAYCGLVRRLADEPDAWHEARLDLVPAGQLEQRAAINRTAVAVPELLLQDLLTEQAARAPDGTAVLDARGSVTYRQLRAEANRIGRRLRAIGTAPNTLVAVVMEKGWEQYAAVYGVLTAGAAYLPIDVTVPADRLRYLLENGAVRVVLTQPWLVDRLAWPEGPEPPLVLAVGEDFAGVDDGPVDAVQCPADLAYVIYTSGSTGEPKGVMVDHRAVINHVRDVNGRFGITPADRGLATAGLHFDMSVYDVFGLVAAGATAVLPAPAERPDPGHWTGLVEREAVTFWACVPPLLEMAVEWAEARRGGQLASLRRVVLAGDWIPLGLPGRLRALAPDVRVTSCGGPTETVNWSIVYEIGDVAPSWASIPYGTPMANQRYHILDAQLAHRPVWTPGQMYVSSEVGLAKGYWRDEAQTRERFLTLPGTGERAYATGDIGRYLADGTIEILGRADFQVKVQGHRIELGEIEAALERCPLVSAAAVVAPTHARSGRRLTAFAVVEQEPGGADTAAALAELGAHLRTLLPAYLVPPDIRAVEELPLTRNGKVDRRALEALARHRPTAGLTDRRPVGTLEQIVAEEFAQTLDLPEVARHDNFFQLGGDSLSGTRLAARLTETFGVDVPLRLVFVLPTVADLAAGLATDPHTGPTVTALVEALASLDASDLTSILQDCAAAAEPGAAD